MRRCALVTGSSRGIGRAAAARLAREGWSVCVNYYQHRAEAEDLVEQIRAGGGAAIAVGADVADARAVEEMVKRAGSELGPVELLVSNAGIAGQALFQDVTDEMWNRYFAVNLGGARNSIRAVLPHMLHEKRGSIVTVSSIWGLRGASCETTYACTKAALIALTRSLALELAPSGIRVNCVAPGVIDTDMVQVLGRDTLRDLAEETPLGCLGTPEDVAEAISYLASAPFVTGQVLCADGGFIV
ncbi:MAG: 3-oxoacyl-ACP reductase FabG [Oscillibacter sp.]|nr:3-oxoacyl-ACP reductase FabG [Oscillibacter sp.]